MGEVPLQRDVSMKVFRAAGAQGSMCRRSLSVVLGTLNSNPTRRGGDGGGDTAADAPRAHHTHRPPPPVLPPHQPLRNSTKNGLSKEKTVFLFIVVALVTEDETRLQTPHARTTLTAPHHLSCPPLLLFLLN